MLALTLDEYVEYAEAALDLVLDELAGCTNAFSGPLVERREFTPEEREAMLREARSYAQALWAFGDEQYEFLFRHLEAHNPIAAHRLLEDTHPNPVTRALLRVARQEASAPEFVEVF
jgi:hypothetical protein